MFGGYFCNFMDKSNVTQKLQWSNESFAKKQTLLNQNRNTIPLVASPLRFDVDDFKYNQYLKKIISVLIIIILVNQPQHIIKLTTNMKKLSLQSQKLRHFHNFPNYNMYYYYDYNNKLFTSSYK